MTSTQEVAEFLPTYEMRPNFPSQPYVWLGNGLYAYSSAGIINGFHGQEITPGDHPLGVKETSCTKIRRLQWIW